VSAEGRGRPADRAPGPNGASGGGWAAALGDEELLAELGRVLRTAQEVPPRFVAAGKASWAWRTIDAELAELAYDSDRDVPAAAASTRAEQAFLRALIFVAGDLSIELEVAPDAVLGQLLPAQAATLLFQQPGHDRDGRLVDVDRIEVPVDPVGWFRLSPLPVDRFRLTFTTLFGRTIVTGWISL
jgi:hypothetical protein